MTIQQPESLGFSCLGCGTWLNDVKAVAAHTCPRPSLTLDDALIDKIAQRVAEILHERA